MLFSTQFHVGSFIKTTVAGFIEKTVLVNFVVPVWVDLSQAARESSPTSVCSSTHLNFYTIPQSPSHRISGSGYYQGIRPHATVFTLWIFILSSQQTLSTLMFWRTVSNSELSAPNEDGNNFSYPLIDLHDPQPEAVPANADRAVYL